MGHYNHDSLHSVITYESAIGAVSKPHGKVVAIVKDTMVMSSFLFLVSVTCGRVYILQVYTVDVLKLISILEPVSLKYFSIFL